MKRFVAATLLALTAGAAHADGVVSLGGSVTEIVYALGQEARLVARDTTSMYPEAVLALPDVGYLRALSPEGVLSVGPSLILAEADAGPAETMASLTAASVTIALMPQARSAEEVGAKIRAVALALQVPAEGEALATRVEAEIAAARDLAAQSSPRKRALFVLSTEGGRLMAAGNGTAAAAMLALAGADNALTGFDGYKPVSDEAVIAAAPEVIVMMQNAGPQAALTDDALFALPALQATPAATARAVVRMDALFLLGFGPRTGQAIAELHSAIYPATGG